MHISKHIKYSFLVIATAFYSCKRDEVSLPTLLITPSQVVQTVESDSLLLFSINLEAEGGLSKFEITESVNNNVPILIYDSTFSNNINNTDITFSYQMPHTSKQHEVVLAFKVYDKNNELGTGSRKIVINALDSLLVEKTNISLYSGNSGKSNAYFISEDSLTFSDSTFFGDIDLVSTDTTDTLSYTLESPIGNKFVVFNSFNYDSVRLSSLTSAYNLGVEVSLLENLKIGDVILTKLANPTQHEYAAIKITDIVDDSGSSNDRYVFSIKK